jgi:hypothetical protein
MSSADVAELLNGRVPAPAHIRKAVHHLTKPERCALYGDEDSLCRAAAGKFFEALVYELVLSVSETSDAIVSVAAKFADADFVPFGKYDPDGLWYSRDGGIRFKVSGKVAAEMDLLIKTADGVRVFGEVISSLSGTGGFRSEIPTKKHLLSRLYGDPVEFLLILPEPPRHGGFRCLGPDDAYAVIPGGSTAYLRVHPGEVLKRKLSPTQSSKRVNGKVW